MQYQGIPELLFSVPASAFSPPPKVESECLRIVRRTEPPVQVKDEELMFKVIRAGFGMRRKTLHNSLGKLAPDIDSVLTRAGVDPKLRAERLGMAEFAAIADALINP